METKAIIEKLTPIFQTVFSTPDLVLTMEMSAESVENWSSLTHMVMMAEVEKTFSIQFKLKELRKLNNVGDLVSAISNKL